MSEIPEWYQDELHEDEYDYCPDCGEIHPEEECLGEWQDEEE